MSRHKHKTTTEGTPNAAEAIPEPREQTNGFEFPVGVATGQATPVKFYCYAAQCPGFSYSASDRAHPVETCGSLMNSLDNPLHVEGKVSETMKENAQAGAAIAATETTGFATDRLSGIFAEGAQPQAEESSEPSTNVEASEQPIPDEIAPSKAAPSPQSATSLGTVGDLLGQVWKTEGGTYLEIVGLCIDNMLQVCEYSTGNGVEAWEVTNHPESIALAVLRHSEVCAVSKAPPWVDKLRLSRFEAFAEGIVGTASETPDQIVPNDPRQNLSRDIDDHCGDIANELGIDRLHVMRLADAILQTLGQFVTLKELTVSSPVLRALGEHFLQSNARDYIFRLAAGIANGPIRKTINDAAQEAVDEFEGKLGEVNERLEGIQTELMKERVEFEKDAESDELDLKSIEAMLASMKEDQARALGELEHRFALLASKLDTINDDLSTVEKRMDEVQPDWKPKAKKPKGKTTPPPKPAASVPSEFDDDEDEVLDIDDDDLGDDDDFDDEDDDLGDDDAVDAVARPVAKPVKKAPQAKAKPSTRPSSPPKKKGGFAFKPPPRRQPKPRGRPRKPMPPVDSRPMGKTPTSESLKTIDQFIGRKRNPKIRVLLSKVPVAKLPKFLASAKKGFFDMAVTNWDIQQQGTFIKWFYAKR